MHIWLEAMLSHLSHKSTPKLHNLDLKSFPKTFFELFQMCCSVSSIMGLLPGPHTLTDPTLTSGISLMRTRGKCGHQLCSQDAYGASQSSVFHLAWMKDTWKSLQSIHYIISAFERFSENQLSIVLCIRCCDTQALTVCSTLVNEGLDGDHSMSWQCFQSLYILQTIMDLWWSSAAVKWIR